MTTFTISTYIHKPVDIIVKALMSADNAPYWTTHLEKFVHVSGAPGEPGCIGHLHYSEKGHTYIMEDKLIFVDPGKKYISEVTGEAVSARVETVLEADGDSTEMFIKWTGKVKGLFFTLIFPFVRHKLIEQSKAELEKFRELVETRGSDFTKQP